MRLRPTIWIVLCLLLAAGAWLFWHANERRAAENKFARTISNSVHPASTAPQIFFPKTVSTNSAQAVASAKTNQFPYRLSNTRKTIGELVNDRRAILLENALIETGAKLNLPIPKNLKSQGDSGAYIVQANGPVSAAFRAMLAAAGAQIVSYIPNDAYLVRISAGGANSLAANSLAQSVIPYEPYYKVQSPLLAFDAEPLPSGAVLNLGLFADNAAATVQQIEKLGGIILSQDRSPFGPIVRVQPPADWTALAQLPGVQIVEANHSRKLANDLSRVTTGVSINTTNNLNYLNLSGSNVIVEVNDTGIDTNHPDLTGRVSGDAVQSLTDTNGHGTFIAGEIAGNGTESTTVTNAEGSINPGVLGQYRGKAPLATLYSVGGIDGGSDTNPISDRYFQETPALTNALISNNSWGFGGDNAYDLAAASYDAATRDALPEVTGSQPVLFVFAAGNDGFSGNNGNNGDDGGGGGNPDTISSPGTAKNVITVGALEQLRNITNKVADANGNTNTQPWLKMTDTSYQVAGYSSRGNVGIGTEGTFGRYKPDVVAPGSFVISTRSTEWNTNAYYNPTNDHVTTLEDVISPGSLTDPPLQFFVFDNASDVTMQAATAGGIGSPHVTLPIYVSAPSTAPLTLKGNNSITLPASPANVNWFAAVSNTTTAQLIYDLTVDVQTTNDLGNYFQVLEGMNDSLGGFYRYESGTSMAAADVSGVLALLQDYFTNTLHTTPSPALLKAMLVNGARPTSTYNFQVQNSINFEGWGLINLPDSLPPGITNQASVACSSFFVDQSPTNALATGDSHTFTIALSPAATGLPLRVTLAWTDPPGNPAAAIKLVNNLDLVVTNLDDPTNPAIYFGNDIPAGGIFNSAWDTNSPPNLDAINNVENVFLPASSGTNFTITIIGRGVNVNAVSAQTNNVVQDYALVVSSGEGEVAGALTVTDNGIVSNPTGDQNITFITTTNAPLMNQMTGASSPLLGTNTLLFTNNTSQGFGSPWQVTVGQTNQWHFYVWTNDCGSNAAFVTFSPDTLSTPREGVFANSDANSTRPEADIDLYVSTDLTLTNLNPIAISNCINSVQVGASSPGGVNGVFNGVSLGRGGTEFVVDTNSTMGQVYYVAVQSEDQMAGEYSFLAVCSDTPFSQLDANGNEIINGVPLPVSIPDGDNAHPGVASVLALALQPIVVQNVVVTNIVNSDNFGDLVGTLTHPGFDGVTVLNNHDSPDPSGINFAIYDDSQNPVAGSIPPDGPGSLQSFVGQQAGGAWFLTEVDDAPSQNSAVTGFTLMIQPHQSLAGGTTNTLAAGQTTNNFVDVPAGATNLTVSLTNFTSTEPLQLFIKFGAQSATNNFDKMITINSGTLFWNGSISVNLSDVPPLQPGRYFITVFNPNVTGTPDQTFSLFSAILPPSPVGTPLDFASGGPVPLLDDAVTVSSNSIISMTNTEPIVSVNVGIRVDHPRISDLVFHLISPDGTRILLMENRGGDTTNGAGATILTTNSIANVTASGTTNAVTNFVFVSQSSGTLPISWDFFTVPDQMTVYDTTNNFVPANLIFDTGMTNGAGQVNLPYTTAVGALTIIINQFGNPNGASGDAWTYTAGGVVTNYSYLTFTEDTNLTTTPIKYAVPPFVPNTTTKNIFTNGFEGLVAADYTNGQTVAGWTVKTNQVSLVTDSANAFEGNSFLALASGTILTNLPTVAGNTYTLTFAYRGPGIAAWWRGENNTNSSVYGNNPTNVQSIAYTNGEVGEALSFDGSSSWMIVPASASLAVTDLTLESWIFPSDANTPRPIIEYGGEGANSPLHLWINTTGGTSVNPGGLHALLRTPNGYIEVDDANPVLTVNQWNHVAFTVNITTGKAMLYCNGILVGTATSPVTLNPQNFVPVNIGYRDATSPETFPGRHFSGRLDEVSIYDRALSGSEIKAIYTNGTAGKFDATEFNVSPTLSLAEAQVSVNGQTPATIYGNNTNWQTKTITFTAVQNGAPLQITGLEPGMLLDDFTLTQVPNNLYYLPEQSLDLLTGTSAEGEWQLEIQDDRVGDTNNASLVSWELQFVFDNTNAVPSIIGGGQGQTNFVGGGGIAWYLINVPTNANLATSFATNRLKFASAPVNVWFDTNSPPTTNILFLPDSAFPSGTNGSMLLSTTNATPLQPPPNIVDGGIYYLGVQNTNSFTVNYGIEVDFDTNNVATPTSFKFISTVQKAGAIQLQWIASPGAQVEVQWTTNLASLAGWNTVTNPATTISNGVSMFTDNGSQTAPLGALRFYRLVQISP